MPQLVPSLAVFLTVAILFAGCTALPVSAPGTPTAPAEPTLTGFTAMGGQCVDTVSRSFAVESIDTGDQSTVRLSGNVSVPDANYGFEAPMLERVDDSEYELRLR